MKRKGASQEEMYTAFRTLRIGPSAGGDDETFLRSWFRDQVLHPHESSHTLAEIWPLLDDLGFTMESTSVNRFAPFTSRDDVIALEPGLEEIGRQALIDTRYFPGFFVFMARAP